MDFLKRRWKWVAFIVLALVLLFLWQSLSGWAMSRKLYGMALDQLREDKTTIVEKLKKDQKEKAKDILDLQNKVKDVQQKRVSAEAESKRLARLVNEKDIEIIFLKKERDAIVIPTDPNALADEFRKRGYKPRVVFPVR
jgi:peptidoglycan hydrolase CwlO-like protein